VAGDPAYPAGRAAAPDRAIRHRGLSTGRQPDPDPDRSTHLRSAGTAALVAGVLAAGPAAGRPGVVATVALVQALLVPAWVLGTDRPGRIGGIVLGLAAAGAADAALVLHDRTSPAALLAVLGLALPAMLVHQLTRGVVRVRVTESLAGVALGGTAVVALSTLVALARAVDGPRLVTAVALAAGAGLVAARLADATAPVPRIADGLPYGLLAVVLAAAAGAAAGLLAAGGRLDPAAGAGVGALVAAVVALVSVGVGFVAATPPATAAGPVGTAARRGGRDTRPSRTGGRRARAAALAYLSAAFPVALVAPVGYLAALAVAG